MPEVSCNKINSCYVREGICFTVEAKTQSVICQMESFNQVVILPGSKSVNPINFIKGRKRRCKRTLTTKRYLPSKIKLSMTFLYVLTKIPISHFPTALPQIVKQTKPQPRYLGNLTKATPQIRTHVHMYHWHPYLSCLH